MSFVDGNTSCQLSEPVVFSFVQLSNILFLRPYHGKHSNLPSLLKRPNIHGIILEVNLRASAILLLVLQLAIIQLIPLMQDQKALIFRRWASLVAEVRAIFVFFDERKGEMYSALLVKRVHQSVDLLWGCTSVDTCDLAAEVFFDDFGVDTSDGFSDIAGRDLQGKHLCRIFMIIQCLIFDSADLCLHLSIHKTRMLWLFLLPYNSLQVFLTITLHFRWSNPLNFRILDRIISFLTDHIPPDASIFDLPQPVLSNFLDLPDHLLSLADLLQILVIILHHMGAVGETIVLVVVAEEVEVGQGLVLRGEEGVQLCYVVGVYPWTHQQNQIMGEWVYMRMDHWRDS